jgi:hypothetical protein
MSPRYTAVFFVSVGMSPTVSELRNEIRVSVGRFEREFDAQFTKEELAAIVDALGDGAVEKLLPPKSEMRAAIRRQVGLDESGDEPGEEAFRKAELEAIAEALDPGDH